MVLVNLKEILINYYLSHAYLDLQLSYMNILITGGFGNIGISVIEECLRREHSVTVFDLKNRRTEKAAKKFSKQMVRTVFGNITNITDVSKAAKDQDAVIHLAAILPPLSNSNPALCRAVNVTGIKNLIDSIKALNKNTVFVEVSSASVMGPTQKKSPPVCSDDPMNGTDNYSKTKIEAETLVEKSGLPSCILRLAAVLPTNINLSYFTNMIKVMFDMPLDARCEIVLDLDVASALVSAAENLYSGGSLCGKKGFIAGGDKNSCRLTNRDMLTSVFKQTGLSFPSEELFSSNINNYYLDWYDTEDMQKILCFQNHSFDQWKSIIGRKLSAYKLPILLFNRTILKWLENQAPDFRS